MTSSVTKQEDILERLNHVRHNSNGYTELADDCIAEIEKLRRENLALKNYCVAHNILTEEMQRVR